MDTDLDWVRVHARLLYQALRWHPDKERVSLLEGNELVDAEVWLTSVDAHEQKPTAEQSIFIAASRWHARLEVSTSIITLSLVNHGSLWTKRLSDSKKRRSYLVGGGLAAWLPDLQLFIARC